VADAYVLSRIAAEALPELDAAGLLAETVPIADRSWLAVSQAPRARLIIVGAGEHAAALCRVANAAGYAVTECDPWPLLATSERFPDASDIVIADPGDYLTSLSEEAGSVDGRAFMLGAAPLSFANAGLTAGRGAMLGTTAPAFTVVGSMVLGAAKGALSISFAVQGQLTATGALDSAASLSISPSASVLGRTHMQALAAQALAAAASAAGRGHLTGLSSPAFAALGHPVGRTSLAALSSSAFAPAGQVVGRG